MVHVVPTNEHMHMINTDLASIMDEAKDSINFGRSKKKPRRGRFKSVNVGISMGGGRAVSVASSLCS
jgi:hypothetical protein